LLIKVLQVEYLGVSRASSDDRIIMPSSKGKPTDPQLREEAKEDVKQSGEGGAPGQRTANKSGRMAQEYEKRGGDYENERASKNKPMKGPPQRKEKEVDTGDDTEEEGNEDDEAQESPPGKRARSDGDGPSRKSRKANDGTAIEEEDGSGSGSGQDEEGDDNEGESEQGESGEEDISSGEGGEEDDEEGSEEEGASD